ncbi:MAG TPA: hypothetical protein VGE67_08915, partial [Haloferula sp.]
AAFVTGRWSNSHSPATEAASASAANESKPTKTSSSASRESASPSKSPRPHLTASSASKPSGFSSEPPFQPGGSKQWLDAQIKVGGWKDDPAALFRMVQNFSAMDEEEIGEMVATYQELIRNYQSSSNAEQAAYPKEWLIKLGLFPALWRYSQLNPEAALDLIEADSILEDGAPYQVGMANLTTLDPDRALARTTGLEGNDLRNAMEPILGTLFATDPDRVISILENYPDPVFDGERRKVAERLAADDPQKAIAYAIAAIRAGRNPDVLKTAVGTWSESHPEDAKRWIETYTGPGAETLK